MTSAYFQQSRPSYISLISGLISQISWIVARHPVDPLHSSPDIWAHADVSEQPKLQPSLTLHFHVGSERRKMIPELNYN